MVDREIVLTPEGYRRIKDEVNYLSNVKREDVAERIKQAREFGDIRENSEYDDAKNEQAMLEHRISTLQEKLRRARSSRLRHRDRRGQRGQHGHASRQEGGDIRIYTIVGSAEADPLKARLSNESPVGPAILGRKPGDEVNVSVPRARPSSRSSPSSEPRWDRRGPNAAAGGSATGISGAKRPASHSEALEPVRRRAFPEGRNARRDRHAGRAVRAPGDGRGRARRHRVAGRLMAKRMHGKVSFLTVQDGIGRAPDLRALDALGEERYEALRDLDVGDIVGAEGAMMRTRRGELSLASPLAAPHQVAAPAAGEVPRPHGRGDCATASATST